jgi:hypothetical protein
MAHAAPAPALAVAIVGRRSMADVTADNLERFIRAVHRRWVVVRLAERVGLGGLGGCAIALVLVSILLWRGQPALPAALLLMGAGSGVGLIAGLLRPPTRVAAAIEADRQLGLSDLLTSALLVRGRAGSDEWSKTILALAEARARELRPGAVMLNRLGARAWGGIGLSAALLLTLTMLSAEPSPSQARDGAIAGNGAHLRVNTKARDKSPLLHGHRSGTGNSVIQHRDEFEESSSVPDPSAPAGQERSSHGARAADPSASSNVDGEGEGAGHTPEAKFAPVPVDATDASPASPERSTDGACGAGLGAPAESTRENAAAATGGTVDPQAQRNAEPWTSPTWRADQRSAAETLRSGAVPDRYRDVVREYFQLKAADEAR